MKIRNMNNGIPAMGYLRLQEVLQIIPMSKSSWYAGIKTGKHPKPVKLGERTAAWRVEDIKALIEKLNS